MATSIDKAAIASKLGSERITITELNSTFQTVTAAAATLYLVIVDNTNNANDAATLKMYDDAAPTVGTDDPDMILTAPAGEKLVAPMHEGVAFATAITAACVKEPGTAGTTSPDNDVNVTFYI